MGAVTFTIDIQLVDALKEALPIDVFVETGTFRGDTVNLIKDRFREIYTIELAPEYHEQARVRFEKLEHVHPICGDSATALQDISPFLRDQSVLYFLDAHWCASDNVTGEQSQCPLIAELSAIGKVNGRSAIIIDDARYFLAPPPVPNDPGLWPSFSEVLSALGAVSGKHRVSVVNDVIVFFPPVAERAVKEYSRMNGVDWLKVLDKSRDYDNLRVQFSNAGKQLQEKEREITSLENICDDRERLINYLDKEIRSLTVLRKEVESLKREKDGLWLVAEDRLRVIKEHEATLKALRQGRITERLKTFFGPRLGILYQHPPKPLRIPKEYTRTENLVSPPVISIVTPTFNQGIFLERTIKSVLSQDYPKLEYIIQDAQSTDGTRAILEKFSKSLTHWESVKDNGQTQAINLGLRHATGEILTYLNSDDLLLPGTLHYVANYFVKHADIDVVYGHRALIDESDLEIGRWVLPPHDDEILAWADYVPQETLFWRRRIWEKIGGCFDESFRFAMDWDLLLRFRDAGAKFVRLPRFLGAFRVHSHQKTSMELGGKGFEEMSRIRKRCHGKTVTEAEISRHVAPYLRKHIIYQKLYRCGLLLY